ncbi:uncharacterized protein FYW61_021904 [Anableps anableps]
MSSFLTFTFRHIGESMISFQLFLFFGYFATAQAAIGLDCYNDYEKIHCQLAVEQCSQYIVKIHNNDINRTYSCSLQQCNNEQCCCSVKVIIVPAETYTITAFENVMEVNSTTIEIIQSLKPRTPTIVSVDEFEGIFTVRWKTNMAHFPDKLTAEVTISKDGRTEKVFENIKPATINGQESYQINGRQLEPDTVYMVSVRSYTDYSQKFSDRSKEFKIITPSAQSSIVLWIVIPLSMFGIFLAVSFYTCFIRIKRKWWDSLPEPKKILVPVMKPEVYEPWVAPHSHVRITTLPSRDDDQMLKMPFKHGEDGSLNCNTSRGSSDPCYGQTEPLEKKDDIADTINKALSECLLKHFAFVVPQPELPQDEKEPHFTTKESSSVSSGIVNHCYFMPVPKLPNLTMEDNSAIKLLGDSRFPCKSNTVNCPDQQIPACLFYAQKDLSSVVQVDMSYQLCKADPKRSSCEENTSLSSTSSGTTIAPLCGFNSMGESSFKRSEERSADLLKLLLPALSSCQHHRRLVDDYKPFPNKVEQPDVLPSENQISESNRDERVIQNTQHCFIPDLKKVNGPCPSVLQTPHFPFLSSDTSIPVVMDSGYKCV